MPEESVNEEMRSKLEEFEKFIEALQEAPKQYMLCLKIIGENALLTNGGSVAEAKIPTKLRGKVKAGMFVKVGPPSGGIFDVVQDFPNLHGRTIKVVRRLPNGMVEVGQEGGSIVIHLKPGLRVEEGDVVQLEPTSTMIVANLGKPPSKNNTVSEETVGIDWDDVGGLEEAKLALKEAIELPIQFPEVFKRYGQRPIKGALLYGPPGCGKTMLGKAAVSSIAKLHGAKSLGSAFIYVKGPELLSKWVGESESIIRSLFDRAREHHKNHGFPAVIFLDEADSLLGARGANRSSDMSLTIVPQFLAEMDSLSDKGSPFVLLATNRPDSLDPAVVRDGRIDRKIQITRPKAPDVQEIFKLNLVGKPLEHDLKMMASHATEELFHPRHALYEVTTKTSKEVLTVGHVVNGAMVAGVVSRAVSVAMRREMQIRKGSCIKEADLTQAVNDNCRQMGHIDMTQDIDLFIESRNLKPVNIKRIHAEA